MRINADQVGHRQASARFVLGPRTRFRERYGRRTKPGSNPHRALPVLALGTAIPFERLSTPTFPTSTGTNWLTRRMKILNGRRVWMLS